MTRAAAGSAPTPEEKRAALAQLVRDGTRPAMLPPSFAQERLWFLEQLTPGTAVFNVPYPARLRAPLDLGALERAINGLVARHEILRTTFAAVAGQPVQVIAPALSIPLEVHDLRASPLHTREAEAQALQAAEASRPFDLARGPLLRAAVARLGRADHLLALTFHHIVCDGWSLGLLGRELTELYAAELAGRPPVLPPLRIQYADFAAWQRDWLRGEVLEEQVAYWRQQLAGLAPLELPADRPRPAAQSFDGGAERIEVPADVVAALAALAMRERGTLFMVLLAAFKVLLARYTGQTDIVVGTYIAGRNRAETESLIGFFVNTLALRTELAGNPRFAEALARVRDVALGAYGHQDMPFAKLVEELQPERDLSRNPLFQVVFQLFNAPNAPRADAAPAASEPHGAAAFDLVFSLRHADDGRITGRVEYSTDLFERETVARMARHYQVLLAGIAADPDRRLSDLPLLVPEERDRILRGWNDTARHYDRETGVLELFDCQVERTPEAVAFRCGVESLSYAALAARSDALARRLLEAGAQPACPVGVCVERSLDLPVALLAAWKAGASYLPLDPSYPRERLGFMLEDAGVRAVIGRGDIAEAIAGGRAPLVAPDEAGAGTAPLARPRTDEIAYLIYTSGSTGWPKGVAVDHRQILNRLWWMWEDYPFADGEVACQKTPAGFVDSLWELLGPLLAGVATVVVPDAVMRDPRALVDLLAEHEVTRIWLVPSLLRTLLDAVADLGRRLPRLGFWVSSGEDLPAELLERFERELPHAVLYNLYGTSEVWDATWHDSRDDPRPLHRVPIGRPISNVRLYLLDRHGGPVPLGATGELYVAGEGLGRGYVNRPELSAERFVELAVDGRTSERAYRTGDLGRYRADGAVEFLGRADQQVKIRGHRVEPAEIEAALSEHRDVRRAVVVARPGPDGESRLTAYVVGGGPAPEGRELRRFLQRRLPDYMLPAAWVALESLPLTPSGKVDRTALPEPAAAAEVPYVAPNGPLQTVLCEQWQDILGVERVGVEDDFFGDLGGHSLLATRAVARIRETLGVDLPLRRFFEATTVRELASALGDGPGARERLEKAAELALAVRDLSEDEVRAMLVARRGG